ncbi:hypothetical protein B296_00040483 [Ensete ventricosum]|uniref:Uncharacterized protein n=1 Tax=Ensete ventricosum TaxID=4639 RepID=A0A426ZQC7_ENSVE|nr:hypothetical protein B296_00040483 [Ensete ventricosum]
MGLEIFLIPIRCHHTIHCGFLSKLGQDAALSPRTSCGWSPSVLAVPTESPHRLGPVPAVSHPESDESPPPLDRDLHCVACVRRTSSSPRHRFFSSHLLIVIEDPALLPAHRPQQSSTSMAAPLSATGLSNSLHSTFHGSWATSFAGGDRAMLARPAPASVRVSRPRRSLPRMGNVNEGKGIFAPLVVFTRNIIGRKRFNQLRGKAIALHSQVSVCVCVHI